MTRPACLAVIVTCLALLAPASARAASGPEQPIRFSHAVHVSGNRIDCRFCHAYATRSASAGIPSSEKCMACHRSIATGNAEVRKVAQSAKERKPVAWQRVSMAPDHVYFPHRKMVNAGIACLTCHPGMDRAEVAAQKQPFTMGWCMKCHRQRGVSIDCWTCHK
ncbi:MAG TPA: cytochrome c3 family protein [Candidatus Deferrimicrobiaceae bacterium]